MEKSFDLLVSLPPLQMELGKKLSGNVYRNSVVYEDIRSTGTALLT